MAVTSIRIEEITCWTCWTLTLSGICTRYVGRLEGTRIHMLQVVWVLEVHSRVDGIKRILFFYASKDCYLRYLPLFNRYRHRFRTVSGGGCNSYWG